MKLFAAMAFGLLALALAGCGFHPLYGSESGGGNRVFSSVYVEPIEEDTGYELRNSLIDLMDATGATHTSAYTLKVTLNDQLQGSALQTDTTITRYNYTLTAKYTLVDSRTNAVVTTGQVSSLAAYNVVASPYSTLVAQKDAQRRTADQLAERIRLDLGVYFFQGFGKMIVKAGDADRFVTKPPSGVSAILVFGPDQGLVRERAEAAAKSVVPDLSDPFRVVEFADGALEADPAQLFDEAAAISMLGGRRVVRVRGAGNALAKLFDDFLDEHAGDALVVVEAGDLQKSAALRKAFEEADGGAAIACYPDSDESIANVVRSALKAEGLTIQSDALDEAVSRLGSDRGITRREVEKLALYMRGQTQVTSEDVLAVMGDESEARLEDVCDAAGEGNTATLDKELEKLWTAGTNPAQIIRTALSHFQRVLLVKIAAERGESVDSAMRKGWPQIHFSRTASFKSQVSRWSEARLSEACDLLLETEALTRTTGVPAEAITGRAFFTIAAMARMRN